MVLILHLMFCTDFGFVQHSQIDLLETVKRNKYKSWLQDVFYKIQ